MTQVSYKQVGHDGRTLAGPWDAIVIGSGIGGLAVATMLAKHARKRVLVLERHYTPGGFTHVFKRPGYEWDVGVHYIGQCEPGSQVRTLFDEVTDGEVEWARMPDCYDRIVIGDDAYELVAGKRRLVDALVARFPSGREAIEKTLELVRDSQRRAAPFYAERALPPSLARVLGPLLRAPMHGYVDRTVDDVLRPVVRDARLFDVLTAQCGDYGLTTREASFAIHAMVMGHYLRGAYYPVGGPQRIAKGAERIVARAGGVIATNAEVRRVLVEGGRARGVEMIDGQRFEAPIVVSDAGARATYLRLLPSDVAERTGIPAALAKVPPSVGHLCLHIGLRHTAEELGLDGSNEWVYPAGDREAVFARYYEDPDAPFPVVYLSFPSAKDPSFAKRFPGRATIEAITPARFSWFTEWESTRWHKRGEKYDEVKARFTDRLLQVLLERRPQLRGKIEHAELSTPLSTAHFVGHAEGEMYGLAHTPARFALPLRARTGIDGFFFTGQDLVSCGVAGALSAGALCGASILAGELPAILRRRGALRPASIVRAARSMRRPGAREERARPM